MFTCPHCHDHQITWSAKSVAFRFAPAKCHHCGGESYVPGLVVVWLLMVGANTLGGFALFVVGPSLPTVGGVLLLCSLTAAVIAQFGLNRDNLRPSRQL